MPDLCKHCGGSGHILVDDLHVRQCICSYAKDMKAHMGGVIAGAPVIYASPLYVCGGDDMTEECVVVRGQWGDVLAHLKWVLFHKGLRFRYRLISDEKLVGVYLGKEAYGSRARGKRDDMETYNGLADLVGEEFHLVIIRLGCLGYSNKAAPGILKEALMLRETLGRPTWLVETSDSIWGDGHRSYSPEVGSYVLERFREVTVKDQGQSPTVAVDGDGDVSLEDASMMEALCDAVDRGRGPSVFQEASVRSDLGDAVGRAKPKGFSRKKRRSDNSGPAGIGS